MSKLNLPTLDEDSEIARLRPPRAIERSTGVALDIQRRRALKQFGLCASAAVVPVGLLADRVARAEPVIELPPETPLGPDGLSAPANILPSELTQRLVGPAADGGRYGGGFWNTPRTVWLRRPATGEEIRSTWWANGQIIQSEYERLCWFMRDVHMQRRISQSRSSGQQVPREWYAAMGVSPAMLDILYATGAWLEWFGMARPLVLTSAFRHPVTNALTEGAARNSMHQRAGACDIVVPDVPAARIAQFGVWLRGGGVGFYPGSQFTHVDDGRPRFWRG